MRDPYRIHRPVRNLYAHTYVLLMVLSFAVTVVATRLLLELTGYPQLGNDTFHIAHALWGGLLLVIASLMTLSYVNRWVDQLAALLAGAGAGLFVDEVGKFITQTNDYFFPLAAPLIYALLLLGVFAYLYTRRRRTGDARADMYDALALIQEVLDDNLETHEQAYLIERLESVRTQTARPDLAQLAAALLPFVRSEAVPVQSYQARWTDRLTARLRAIETRWLTRVRFRRILTLVLALLSAGAFIQTAALVALLVNRSALNETVWAQIIQTNPLVRGTASLNSFLVSVGLEFLLGCLWGIATLLSLRPNPAPALRLSAVTLIVSLTLVNLLKFYFNQFSVVVESLTQFAILMAIFRYQQRFSNELREPPAPRLSGEILNST